MSSRRPVPPARSPGPAGRPPRTSGRYGPPSSKLPAPPYAINSTATPPPSAAMDPVHDALQRLDRRLRQHAVPEVEDVAGAARGPVEHVAHPLLERGERREQRRGIEVPLNRPVGADALPRDVEGNPPVHADDVAAGAGEVGAKHGGVEAAMGSWGGG